MGRGGEVGGGAGSGGAPGTSRCHGVRRRYEVPVGQTHRYLVAPHSVESNSGRGGRFFVGNDGGVPGATLRATRIDTTRTRPWFKCWQTHKRNFLGANTTPTISFANNTPKTISLFATSLFCRPFLRVGPTFGAVRHMVCRACGLPGHNARTCRQINPYVARSPIPPPPAQTGQPHARLQKEMVSHFDSTYPESRLLLHASAVGLGPWCSAAPAERGRAASHNRSLGVRAGVPDLVLYKSHQGTSARFRGVKVLFIEIKTGSATLTAEQRTVRDLVQREGHAFQVVRSLDEFRVLIREYMMSAPAAPIRIDLTGTGV